MTVTEAVITKSAIAPATTLLLVDDDDALGTSMREFFAQQGLRLECVQDGRRGLARVLDGHYDLVLLNQSVPGLDGIDLLVQMRRQSAVPVILLLERTDQYDRAQWLDSGADDVLPKPIEPEELLARVRAVLRRTRMSPWVPDEELVVPPVRLVPSSRELWCEGEDVSLTSHEFDILEVLVRAAGRVVSRRELTAALHHRALSPFDRSLDVHICHIRKKLGPRGNVIRTVRGVGYLFRPRLDAGPEHRNPYESEHILGQDSE